MRSEPYMKKKRLKQEESSRLPPYLEAFEKLKNKIEQAENTTFQKFLEKIRTPKKN